MPRLIVANLDAESEFVTLTAKRTRIALSRAARAVAAEVGTLLRAFARKGDTLSLPAPIEPSRLAAVEGLPRPPGLVSMPTSSPASVLAWAETPNIERLRGGCVGDGPLGVERGLHEALWQLPVPSPAVAATCNDRRLALELARTLGTASSTARVVRSFDQVVEASEEVPGPWVVKARFAAAGRWRYIHRGGSLPRARIAGLLARHGPLVFESWVERTDDFGVSALLDIQGKARIVSFHRQMVDRDGRFRGLETAATFTCTFDLAVGEQKQVMTTVKAVGVALHERGYVGPFGIDAWRYRTASGDSSFQSLGEINARMTVGLVARVLIDRVRAIQGWRGAERIVLRFGRRVPEGALALLHPVGHPKGGGAIWLEVS